MLLCRLNIFKWISVPVVLLLLYSVNTGAETVKYQFDIDYKEVNFTGQPVKAMSVGGVIPAPTIEASVGDILQVTFHNRMPVESSIHWHGVLLPNDQDGVSYLTTPPIKAGGQLTFEYPVTHSGTYWYHSHTGLQEQRGVYGSIIFHPQQGEVVSSDYDQVLVLSDWTDENPDRVLHNLKKADDYYALKKNSVQSWKKVFELGGEALKNRISNAWIRMEPMDISDVGYDTFLLNGKKEFAMPQLAAGKTVRLRVINAAASSYFYLEFAGGPMTIVAADGVDVQPLTVQRQRIAIAETFDVIVEIPDGGAYEFRATSEDATGYASAMLGQGKRVLAPTVAKPEPMLMSHASHGGAESGHVGAQESMIDHSMHGGHHDHHTMSHDQHGLMADHSAHSTMDQQTEGSPPKRQQQQEYEWLKATAATDFNADSPRRVVDLALTGDMERYAWSFNNKVLSEDSKILIRKGEVVQFVLDNKTMMHHPIHLHGHFFRVLNGQGKYSPLKHTVSVPPMEKLTIEFSANEEKDWFFHCHNLYHMKTGMSRVISYADTSTSTRETLKPLFADRHWFHFADLGVQNNFTHGNLRLENTRNAWAVEYDWDYDSDYEVEAVYERYVNRYVEWYVGGKIEQEEVRNERERESTAIVGIHYLLPLLIEADLRFDSDGKGWLALGSDLQLTDRLAFDWYYNTDDEYHMQLEYELSKQWVITAGVDDHYDWGAGFEWRY